MGLVLHMRCFYLLHQKEYQYLLYLRRQCNHQKTQRYLLSAYLYCDKHAGEHTFIFFSSGEKPVKFLHFIKSTLTFQRGDQMKEADHPEPTHSQHSSCIDASIRIHEDSLQFPPSLTDTHYSLEMFRGCFKCFSIKAQVFTQ